MPKTQIVSTINIATAQNVYCLQYGSHFCLHTNIAASKITQETTNTRQENNLHAQINLNFAYNWSSDGVGRQPIFECLQRDKHWPVCPAFDGKALPVFTRSTFSQVGNSIT